MDVKSLENLRVKKLLKLIVLDIINTIAMISVIIFLSGLLDDTGRAGGRIIGFAIFIFLVIYGFIHTIPKNYENVVKRFLLPHMLKYLTKNDGEIKWQPTEFVEKDKTTKDKVIDKLESKINKQCSIKINIDELTKNIDFLREKDELEEKEYLTPDEQKRLKEIKEFDNQYNKKQEMQLAEKYEIRLKMLKELEQKNLLNNNEENTWKIEYLKKENEKHVEYLEIAKNEDELNILRKKEFNEITKEDHDRIEFLQNKISEYTTRITKDLVDIEHIDRGLCLFSLFNTSVSYDDVFYGSYKNIEFIAIEGSEEKIFNGTVIRLPLNIEFDNALFLEHKPTGFQLAGVNSIKQEMHSIKLENSFNKKYKISAKSTDGISNIFDDKFIDYVNNSKNNFSYAFKENYAYLIWPHKKDYFKLGSLFKSVKNKKQYDNCKKDIILMLQEVEKFGSNSWVKTADITSKV